MRAAIDAAVSEAASAAAAHQGLFCRLCGAAPGPFAGGDPGRAAGVIRIVRTTARHHRGLEDRL